MGASGAPGPRAVLGALIWMTAEGVLGLVAGIHARSISLLGWTLG